MKKKFKVAIIVALITGLTGILAAVLSSILGRTNEYSEPGIANNEGILIQGDGNNLYNETNIYNSLDDFFKDKNETELLNIAYKYIKEDDVDIAVNIYNKLKDNKYALINLSLIYVTGNSSNGISYKKAEEYYIKADCVEAKRGLLALYLYYDGNDNKFEEKLEKLLYELLYDINDEVVWNYISLSLFDMEWAEYSQEYNVSKQDFSFSMYELYEWEYTYNYYRGYNPPSDKHNIRWIFNDIDFENTTPYAIYRQQLRVYLKNITLLKGYYYEQDGNMYMDGNIEI